MSKFKDWLKVFGLSFFSDKIASRAAKKGATLIIISLIFTFVFFFCGYLGASVVPFSTHYKNAYGYRSFLYGVFTDENALNLAMDGGKAKVTKSDNTEIQVVNTYENATDAEKYAKNGYNLIIDTRSSRSFIEFEEYAVNGDERISYETYLGLGKAEKSNYQLRVHCTDELYTIGEKEVTKFTAFFDDITSSESKNYNSAAAIAYKKLNKNAPSYNDDLYRLYVKYYYTDISSVVTGESVPVLRDYYYREYVHNSNSHYFYIFDDMCAGSFETNNEIPVVFGGYCESFADDAVIKNQSIQEVDAFVNNLFYNTVPLTIATYLVNTLMLTVYVIFMPLILAFIMWIVGKFFAKGCLENRYIECYKIVSSFVFFTALITSLLVFFMSFGVSASLLYKITPYIFLGILLIRVIAYCLDMSIHKRKALKKSQNTVKNDFNDVFPEYLLGGNDTV